MTIDEELASFVRTYAEYNKERAMYEANANTAIKLEEDFVKFINKLLFRDGPETSAIQKIYKQLSLKFHSDRSHSFSPEIKWLEEQLSDGICMKTLNQRYSKFIDIDEPLVNFARDHIQFEQQHVMKVDPLIRLDADFVRLMNQLLLRDGPETEAINRIYRRLCLKLSFNENESLSPEIKWLEMQLSQGKMNGACMKTVNMCYEKFTDAQKFKKIELKDIKSTADCKQWLNNRKASAKTYSGRSLCDSLIELLDQSGDYFDDAGQIKSSGLQYIVKTIPVLVSTYGIYIFTNEIFAAYVVSALLLKGGKYLQKNDSEGIQQIGIALQNISIITATASTALITKLIEVTFWGSRQCLNAGLQISTLFSPALPLPSPAETAADVSNNLCSDLIVVKQKSGILFQHPELAAISEPLRLYIEDNNQQIGRGFRIGQKKFRMIESCLFRLHVLDALSSPLEEKLKKAGEELEAIKRASDVYTSRTATAVDKATAEIEAIRDNSQALILYQPSS